MKHDLTPLKVGEMSDEIQDYKIIKLENETAQHYKEILRQFGEIKDYIYNTQDNLIRNLERRLEHLEEAEEARSKREEEQKQSKKETNKWIKRTMASAVIVQFISMIFIGLALFLGLR